MAVHESELSSQLFVLTHFPHAKRGPLRLKMHLEPFARGRRGRLKIREMLVSRILLSAS
jgi:hypothetical protein